MLRRLQRLALPALLLLAAPALLAFALFPQNGFLGYTWSKWGDPAPGTPATVYWSLMPVGTEGSDYCAPICTNGPSTLTLPNFYDWTTHGFRALELDSPEGVALIQGALDAWGAVANVTFVRIPDSGVPLNDPTAEPPATGQIRIGVFEMGANAPAGVGYAAPPNGFIEGTSQLAPGAGDLILNPAYGYQNPAGAEGDPLESFPQGGGLYLNDLGGLLAHEIGHTLGIDHSDLADALMCGWPYSCIWADPETYAINREPGADDVAAVQTLYGAPPDADADGVRDAVDNCTLAANPTQLDADDDGFGNACDGDLNNSGGAVNFADLALFRAAFGTTNAAADINGSGSVNFADLAIFRALFGKPPGPAGVLVSGM